MSDNQGSITEVATALPSRKRRRISTGMRAGKLLCSFCGEVAAAGQRRFPCGLIGLCKRCAVEELPTLIAEVVLLDNAQVPFAVDRLQNNLDRFTGYYFEAGAKVISDAHDKRTDK